MSTYKELQDQIAALQKQAEDARKQEIAAVVNEIRAKMAEFGISVDDLGYSTRGRSRKKSASGAYKYRNPATGETWTGKGRKPGWMVKALQEGKSMDNFLA